MIKNKLYQKLIIAGIASTLLVSGGVVAFANTNKASGVTTSKIEHSSVGRGKGDFKGGMKKGNPLADILATQVTAGVITQAESDSATAFIKTKEATEKAARDAQKATRDSMTDAQKAADKVAKDLERTTEKAKLDTMTDAEKKAYMESKKPVKDTILAELVTAGIFKQAQADKIQTAMKAKMAQRPEMGRERGESSKKRSNGTSNTVTE